MLDDSNKYLSSMVKNLDNEGDMLIEKLERENNQVQMIGEYLLYSR